MNQLGHNSINQRKNLHRSDILMQSLDEFVEDKQAICRITNKFSSPNLTLDDWSLINNVSHAYDSWALATETNHLKNYSLEDSSLVTFLNDEGNVYRNLIEFFKQIPQFRKINLEDQILLIKCNITHLVHIHHVLKDHFKEDPEIGLYMSQWISPDFHEQMSKTRHSLDCFVEHPLVLKLALLVFIFVVNLSRLPDEQLSMEVLDPDLLMKTQNFFLTLLWKYLNVVYNEKDARRATQSIVFQYLRYQILMNEMETIIIQQNKPEQFHPLTKSVLRLT